MPDPLRAKLLLCKAPIVDRGPGWFKINIEGTVTMVVRPNAGTDHLDLRDGDMLSIYTEVLFRQEGST